MVDAAAAAGHREQREQWEIRPCQPSPFFLEATGYTTYKTPGGGVRAAVSMPNEGALITELPTGTEIAVSLAQFSQREGRTVPGVVPTVALAYDFERRFPQPLRATPGVKGPGLAVFAWTGDTDDDSGMLMRRSPYGAWGPSVTSPRLGGALHGTLGGNWPAPERVAALRESEQGGTWAWGHDFRPEFRELAALRRASWTLQQARGSGR